MKRIAPFVIAMLAVSSIVFAWYIIANAKPNFSEDCSYTIDELENQFQSGGLGPKTTANVVSTLKYNCENDLSDASSTFIVGINEYVAASAEEMNEQASLVLYSFVNLCQNLQKEPGIDLSHNAKKLCGEAEEKSKDRYEEENYQSDQDAIQALEDVNDLDRDGESVEVDPYEVSYFVNGSGLAYVYYTDKDNNFKTDYVSLPWGYDATFMHNYTTVIVDAEEEGTVSCSISVDGSIVDTSSETGSYPSASCYHFK